MIVTDLRDTVFQGDPFSDRFDTSSLGFSMESRACDNMHVRETFAILGQRNAKTLYRNRQCVNPGTIVGVESAVLAFLEGADSFVRRIRPSTLAKLTYVPDQVILNVVVGLSLVSNIRLRFFRGFEEYMAMWKWFGRPNITYRIGDFRVWADAPFPMIVHMYDRGKKFCASVSEVCPPTFPTNDPYTMCFVPGW
jgi:hypothetical protein